MLQFKIIIFKGIFFIFHFLHFFLIILANFILFQLILLLLLLYFLVSKFLNCCLLNFILFKLRLFPTSHTVIVIELPSALTPFRFSIFCLVLILPRFFLTFFLLQFPDLPLSLEFFLLQFLFQRKDIFFLFKLLLGLLSSFKIQLHLDFIFYQSL